MSELNTQTGPIPLAPLPPVSAPDHMPAPDRRVGTRLGKYALLGRLGQGGMGVVYEAEDTLLKRRVAVKFLTDSLAADADARQRFLQEARAAARLNHPHVVTIHEVDQHDGTHFLVMELAAGGSVQDRLRRQGPLPWPEATRVLADACRGLAAAHAAGLIHRDIKPANLMLSAAGEGKLADFGLAKVTDQLGPSLRGTLLGTPHYMSPEQCRCDTVDDLSDVYALGATYHALLTGQPPYRKDLALQVMYAHCCQPVPDPRDANPAVPAACAAIVQHAMAKRPADRFASAAEMLTALEAVLTEAGEQALRTTAPPLLSTADTAPPGQEPLPVGERRQLGLLVPLVAAVLLLLAVIWHGLLPPSSPLPVREPPAREEQAALVGPPAPPPEVLARAAADRQPLTFRDRITAAGHTLSANGPVGALAFSRNAAYLAAADGRRTGNLRVWDLTTGAIALEWRGPVAARPGPPPGEVPCALVFMSAGHPVAGPLARGDGGGNPLLALAVGGGPARGLHIFRVGDPPRWLRRLDLPAGTVLDLAFALAPASAWLAVLREENGQHRVSVLDLASGKEAFTLHEGLAGVRSLALWAEAAPKLALVENGSKIRVWEPAQREEVVLHTGTPVGTAAFYPKGNLLALGAAREFQVWRLNQKDSREVGKTGFAIQHLAVSPEGPLLAVAGAGRFELYQSRTFRRLHVFAGHSTPVFRAAFAYTDPLLASVSRDGMIRLWDVGAWTTESKP